MIKDLVTVIVACYNGEKFIEQCFNCILRQTYKNIEIVLVMMVQRIIRLSTQSPLFLI